jgi:hypothetical protein
MSFSSVPLLATGDWIDAAWGNTYWKDNLAALWPYTAAGDISYAAGATSLAKLAKPSVDSVLKNTSSGVPSWLALTQLKGALHAIGTVDFAPGGQSFASTWADITGATLTLTLAVTCTVVVMAQITGYNPTTGNAFIVRGMVDGTGDAAPNQVFNGGSSTAARNEALGYIYRATGITAGSRIVKMQCQANGSTNYVERGRLIALAFAE